MDQSTQGVLSTELGPCGESSYEDYEGDHNGESVSGKDCPNLGSHPSSSLTCCENADFEFIV